jgi:hypothetical protein
VFVNGILYGDYDNASDLEYSEDGSQFRFNYEMNKEYYYRINDRIYKGYEYNEAWRIDYLEYQNVFQFIYKPIINNRLYVDKHKNLCHEDLFGFGRNEDAYNFPIYKKNGQYYVEYSGKKHGGYDDVKLINTDRPDCFAFKKDKWWYVNMDGYIHGKYNDARPPKYRIDKMEYGFWYEQNGKEFIKIYNVLTGIEEKGPYKKVDFFYRHNGDTYIAYLEDEYIVIESRTEELISTDI